MSPLIVGGRADQLQVLQLQPSSHLRFQQLVLILQQNHVKSMVQIHSPYAEGENNQLKKKKRERLGKCHGKNISSIGTTVAP